MDLIRAPELNVGVKGRRGVVSERFVSPALLEQLGVDLWGGAYVTLKLGEATPVPVTIPGLPGNANVLAATAVVHVRDASDGAQPQQTSVEVKKQGSDPAGASGTYQVSVAPPSRPQNVQLALGKGDPIWTFPGTLTEQQYAVPDFAGALNAYLDEAHQETVLTALPFVVKSSTSGQVGLELKTLDYSLIKTQAWPNPLDSTTRVDRNLPLELGAVERLPLDAIATQSGQRVSLLAIKLDVGGQFSPDRLLGNVEPHDGRQFATISGDYSLAQGFTLSGDLLKGASRCTGIACYFQTDEKVELYVELQKDAGGFPAADAPLAKSSLALTPPEKPDEQPWTFVKFEAPADLKADVPYWIVVKGVRGKARLGLLESPADDPATSPVVRGQVLVNRGGQIWKSPFRAEPSPRVVALLGVVYLPGSDDQTAAVRISVEGQSVAERVDPGKVARTITLDVGGADLRRAVLVISSHAQGTLSVANVIQEYKLA